MHEDPTFWILARASGITAYVLLWAVVMAGLTLRSRAFRVRLRPAAVTDVHRILALLALGAIALHGCALMLDRVVHLSFAALLIPGLARYRPLPTALGVVAAELAVVLVVSFPLRRRIGIRVWRALHWASYVAFAAAAAHGIGAGSDAAQPAARWLYAGSVATVAGATGYRALVRTHLQPRPSHRREVSVPPARNSGTAAQQ
jgi:sulfoxide reductase heme-binding subunit YedZ